MNRNFEIINHGGENYGLVIRTLKNIPLYEISLPKAEIEMGWDSSRRVSYTETHLIVYLIGGKEQADRFTEWADELERYQMENWA